MKSKVIKLKGRLSKKIKNYKIMSRESMEKMFGKKIGEDVEKGKKMEKGKIGKTLEEEVPGRGIMSKEELAKVKAKDEKELGEVRKKIGEMPERGEEKRMKTLYERYPGAPESLLKSYIEATKKVAEMGISKKLRELRGDEKLKSKEQLALQDWNNIRATLEFGEKSGKVIEGMKGVEGILKEAVEKKKEK